MRIKELIWIDNISESGKEEGLFEIISYVYSNGPKSHDSGSILISFTIRNYIPGNGFEIKKNGYDLWVKKGIFNEVKYEFQTIDEAKKRCQEEFQNRIEELFYIK